MSRGANTAYFPEYLEVLQVVDAEEEPSKLSHVKRGAGCRDARGDEGRCRAGRGEGRRDARRDDREG